MVRIDSLFRGARDRRGGATGGFEGSLGIADVAYRLGTGSAPVSPAEVGGLLARHRGQVGLSFAHEADLRRVLAERPAFAAWARFTPLVCLAAGEALALLADRGRGARAVAFGVGAFLCAHGLWLQWEAMAAQLGNAL